MVTSGPLREARQNLNWMLWIACKISTTQVKVGGVGRRTSHSHPAQLSRTSTCTALIRPRHLQSCHITAHHSQLSSHIKHLQTVIKKSPYRESTMKRVMLSLTSCTPSSSTSNPYSSAARRLHTAPTSCS